ncbi:hypothetical protein FM037_13400 [Shewanella psychropiezotolerans]|uniref:Uncharacterized protein n=1 Tax=Shewanella psychropiezotolerans TaxID=2593655 RepID=A0ABX5WY71_9GAMM|nr:hypothetical protein [Shewanella psychropiezotolerans]QDO84053.1 hypothetical protein FM037_13400 [Shewanella psychropiezotolerans]
MKDSDFSSSVVDGQLKVVNGDNYWLVEIGRLFVTGKFEGQDIVEFASASITTRREFVLWIQRVFYC